MIDIDKFASRHIGPRNQDIIDMLKVVNCSSLDDLIEKTIPDHIIFKEKLKKGYSFSKNLIEKALGGTFDISMDSIYDDYIEYGNKLNS